MNLEYLSGNHLINQAPAVSPTRNRSNKPKELILPNRNQDSSYRFFTEENLDDYPTDDILEPCLNASDSYREVIQNESQNKIPFSNLFKQDSAQAQENFEISDKMNPETENRFSVPKQLRLSKVNSIVDQLSELQQD